MLPLHAIAAECGADGTLVRDAAQRGAEAAYRMVNVGAADVMTAAQARAKCLERFGVQSIPPLGGGNAGSIIAALANNALESACNQARGAAGRYLQEASSVASGAMPTVGGVSLPDLASAQSPGTVLVNAGTQIAQQQVNQQLQQAEQGVWQRMQCWVIGCNP